MPLLPSSPFQSYMEIGKRRNTFRNRLHSSWNQFMILFDGCLPVSEKTLLNGFACCGDSHSLQGLCAAAAVVSCGGLGADIAETKALLEGIRMASGRGFLPLVVESNALNVVSSCNSVAHGVAKEALGCVSAVLRTLFLVWTQLGE
ncbi:hypothetical protein ACOSQ2_009650 [Xanthoceras sorbifolium]